MPAQTALVLQGGGALGAFEFGALKRLYQQPDFAPDIVSGVSIGAVNAACIVGGRNTPINTLTHIWGRFAIQSPGALPDFLQRAMSLWGNPHFFNMRSDYLAAPFWTSFYNTTPLRRVLLESIDFDKLNHSPTKIILSATNVQTGQIELFDNHHQEKPLTVDHLLASCSLPPTFPATKINGKTYWDGGLFNNTPLAPVIERMDPDPDSPKQIYVINLFPNQGRLPENMFDVFDRMIEMIFSNKLVNDIETARKVDEFVEAMNYIDTHLSPAARKKIRAMPGYKRLASYKLIKNITLITDTEPETASGPLDFSQKAIRRRTAAGYLAADRLLTPSRRPRARTREPALV
jgi:predicted acylesterase/phospholipase RssA